jgi:hypothetical protein
MFHHVKYLKGRKMMELSDVAVIAHEGARQAVHAAMEARSRPSPWEVTEAWLKIRVMELLCDSFREASPLLRIVDELRADADRDGITNIKVGDDLRTHPFDLSVLYPVDDGDPWSGRSREALGLIELKKYDQPEGVRKDMELLGKAVQRRKGSSRLLKWTLFVVFVNGKSSKEVTDKSALLKEKGSKHKLSWHREFTSPEQAPLMPGRDSVGDQYFQIVCLGREL